MTDEKTEIEALKEMLVGVMAVQKITIEKLEALKKAYNDSINTINKNNKENIKTLELLDKKLCETIDTLNEHILYDFYDKSYKTYLDAEGFNDS